MTATIVDAGAIPPTNSTFPTPANSLKPPTPSPMWPRLGCEPAATERRAWLDTALQQLAELDLMPLLRLLVDLDLPCDRISMRLLIHDYAKARRTGRVFSHATVRAALNRSARHHTRRKGQHDANAKTGGSSQ